MKKNSPNKDMNVLYNGMSSPDTEWERKFYKIWANKRRLLPHDEYMAQTRIISFIYSLLASHRKQIVEEIRGKIILIFPDHSPYGNHNPCHMKWVAGMNDMKMLVLRSLDSLSGGTHE